MTTWSAESVHATSRIGFENGDLTGESELTASIESTHEGIPQMGTLEGSDEDG
jgi:hypothetical protein